MQYLFSVTLFVLLSTIAVSAQTAKNSEPGSERKVAEYASHLKDPRLAAREGKPVDSDSKKAKLKEEAALRAPGVVRLGPSRTYLKTGLSTNDVVRFLGKPASVSEARQEGDARLTTYVFPRGEGRVIIAEFADGALVRLRSETR